MMHSVTGTVGVWIARALIVACILVVFPQQSLSQSLTGGTNPITSEDVVLHGAFLDVNEDGLNDLQVLHEVYLKAHNQIDVTYVELMAWKSRWTLEHVYSLQLRLDSTFRDERRIDWGSGPAQLEQAKANVRRSYFEVLRTNYPDRSARVDEIESIDGQRAALRGLMETAGIRLLDTIILNSVPDAIHRPGVRHVLRDYYEEAGAALQARSSWSDVEWVRREQSRLIERGDLNRLIEFLERGAYELPRFRQRMPVYRDAVLEHLTEAERAAFEQEFLRAIDPMVVINRRENPGDPLVVDSQAAVSPTVQRLVDEIGDARSKRMAELRAVHEENWNPQKMRLYIREHAEFLLGLRLEQPLYRTQQFRELSRADAIASQEEERRLQAAMGKSQQDATQKVIAPFNGHLYWGIHDIIHRIAERWDHSAFLNHVDVRNHEHLALVEFFLEEYTEQLRALTAEVKSQWESAAERLESQSPDYESIDRTLTPIEQRWVQQRKELSERLDNDLLQILNDGEFKRWEIWRTDQKRRRTLAALAERGTIRHRTDLVEGLESVGFDFTRHSKTLEIVAAYRETLDRDVESLLNRHLTLLRRSGIANWDQSRGVPNAEQRVNETFDQWNALIQTIDRRQAQFEVMLAAALPPDASSAFREAVNARNYPGVYTPSPIEIVDERWSDLEAMLSPAARQAVREIIDSHLPQQRASRHRLIHGFERWDSPTEKQRRRDRYAEIQAAGGDVYQIEKQHFAFPHWDADNRLVTQSLQQIRAAIPDEEFEALSPDLRLLLGWE